MRIVRLMWNLAAWAGWALMAWQVWNELVSAEWLVRVSATLACVAVSLHFVERFIDRCMLHPLVARSWQPISTAPRDGTVVLVLDRYNDASRAKWDGEGLWQTYHGACKEDGELVAWMSCPTLPASSVVED